MIKILGVSINTKNNTLCLWGAKGKNQTLMLFESSDGQKFSAAKVFAKSIWSGKKVTQGNISSLRFSFAKNKIIVYFLNQVKQETLLCQATVKENSWAYAKVVPKITETSSGLVLNSNKQTAYFGDRNIYFAEVSKLGKWKVFSNPVLRPRENFFDNQNLQVGQVRKIEQGILVTYYCKLNLEGFEASAVGAVLFDSENSSKVLWRSDYPLWQQDQKLNPLKMQIVGEVDFKGQTWLFLQDEQGGVHSIHLPLWNLFAQGKRPNHKPKLERTYNNPVLTPKPEQVWESKAVFNPAAFVAKGRVHLIYRAIGDEDVSTFGYASSRDGIHFDERHDQPIYFPRKDFEGRSLKKHTILKSPYASGGSGIGGCEDPRISLIEDILYMTYVAFDGFNPPRVALSTISLEDFLAHKWNWKEPVLISPYLLNEGNKNSCILPEKINGQYVVFHRIWPDILLDFVEDINFDGKKKFLSKKGHTKISPRRSHWDSRKVGIGATPIKTPVGWLLIYQAVGSLDSGKYKIGAMLLDLQNPSEVIARSNTPILEPEAWYETEGLKYGVVYPCGAVVLNDDLFVYYGGADTYTCVARANLSEFLTHLLTHQSAVLDPVDINNIYATS